MAAELPVVRRPGRLSIPDQFGRIGESSSHLHDCGAPSSCPGAPPRSPDWAPISPAALHASRRPSHSHPILIASRLYDLVIGRFSIRSRSLDRPYRLMIMTVDLVDRYRGFTGSAHPFRRSHQVGSVRWSDSPPTC